jgi:CheY-like chemotaxis protein
MIKPLHLLLADDDKDDRFFFKKVLEELPVAMQLTTVENGEKLIQFLTENTQSLPDALFLDLNMPRKNGLECLSEIKSNKKLKHLPVIVHSTSLNKEIADILYTNGAHYYTRKTDIMELSKVLHYIIQLMVENKFIRPTRKKFILDFREN